MNVSMSPLQPEGRVVPPPKHGLIALDNEFDREHDRDETEEAAHVADRSGLGRNT